MHLTFYFAHCSCIGISIGLPVPFKTLIFGCAVKYNKFLSTSLTTAGGHGLSAEMWKNPKCLTACLTVFLTDS